MHYRPRATKPKVVTPRFEIDYRILDLLETHAALSNKSKNNIFERAILQTCKSPRLTFNFKRRLKKKYLVKEETLELIELTADRLRISKNELVNKALKDFLLKNELGLRTLRYV